MAHILESQSSLVSRSCELFLIVSSRSNNYNLNMRHINFRFNVGLIPNKMLAKNMESFKVTCILGVGRSGRGIMGGYGTILFFFFRVGGKELLGCGIVLFPWDKGCGTIVMFQFHHTFFIPYILSTIPHFVQSHKLYISMWKEIIYMVYIKSVQNVIFIFIFWWWTNQRFATNKIKLELSN